MAVPVLGEWAMASQQGYGQFCPVAMAAEVLGSRWTILVLRELICGSTRFNELRRGVPPSTLLSGSPRITADCIISIVVGDALMTMVRRKEYAVADGRGLRCAFASRK